MELIEIVKKQREVYIRQLTEFYEKRAAGAKELLLAYNTDDPVMLFNLSRMDYIERSNENDYKIEELSPDSYINHPTIEFTNGSLTISLNPFFWHGCEFVISPKLNDISFIENWAKKWIDEDEILKLLDSDLSNAIHNVSIPEYTDNDIRFTVDFGTSTDECFSELLTEIKNSGATNVIINSFDLIDDA